MVCVSVLFVLLGIAEATGTGLKDDPGKPAISPVLGYDYSGVSQVSGYEGTVSKLYSPPALGVEGTPGESNLPHVLGAQEVPGATNPPPVLGPQTLSFVQKWSNKLENIHTNLYNGVSKALEFLGVKEEPGSTNTPPILGDKDNQGAPKTFLEYGKDTLQEWFKKLKNARTNFYNEISTVTKLLDALDNSTQGISSQALALIARPVQDWMKSLDLPQNISSLIQKIVNQGNQGEPVLGVQRILEALLSDKHLNFESFVKAELSEYINRIDFNGTPAAPKRSAVLGAQEMPGGTKKLSGPDPKIHPILIPDHTFEVFRPDTTVEASFIGTKGESEVKVAFTAFASHLNKVMESHFLGSFTLFDFIISFRMLDNKQGSLSGNITLHQGSLEMDMPFEYEDVLIVPRTINYLTAHYTFKTQKVILQYNYLMETTTEKMSGTLRATFKDVKLEVKMYVRKTNGTCQYLWFLLLPEFIFKDHFISSTFETKQGFKSPDATMTGLKLINSYLRKRNLYQIINKVLVDTGLAKPFPGTDEKTQQIIDQMICSIFVFDVNKT